MYIVIHVHTVQAVIFADFYFRKFCSFLTSAERISRNSVISVARTKIFFRKTSFCYPFMNVCTTLSELIWRDEEGRKKEASKVKHNTPKAVSVHVHCT